MSQQNPNRSYSANEVNSIFGENLRLLCLERGTISETGHALGISPVQMSRYIKGDSFPKPHVLRRFCDYFEVSSEIYDTKIQDLRAARPKENPHNDEFNVQIRAMKLDQTPPICPLPVGYYLIFRASVFLKNRYKVDLAKISQNSGVTKLRYYEARGVFPLGSSRDERLCNGILLHEKERSWFLVCNVNTRAFCAISFGTLRFLDGVYAAECYYGALSGIQMKITPTLFMPLGDKLKGVLPHRHMIGPKNYQDLPKNIADVFDAL